MSRLEETEAMIAKYDRSQMEQDAFEWLVARLRAAERVIEAADKAWTEIRTECVDEDEALWYLEVLEPMRVALDKWTAGVNTP